MEIRFIIGPKWPHSRNWLQRDDYHPQIVCPQHASNFYEPGFLGAWTLAVSSSWLLAGHDLLPHLDLNLKICCFKLLHGYFYQHVLQVFCVYLPCNVGSWEWAWNGFAAANVCPNWTHCLAVIQSIGQKETFFLGCLEAQPSCWLDGRVCWLVSRFICVLIWAINMVN